MKELGDRPLRIGILLAAYGLYSVAFFLLYAQWGSSVGALVIIPTVAGGWFLGVRGGLLAGVAGLFVNTLLLNLAGESGWDAIFQAGGGPGMVAAILIGGGVGYARQMQQRLASELARRRRTEEALRRQHNELLAEKEFSQALMDALPGIFVLIDERGHLLRWNRTLEEVTGKRGEEMARLPASHLLAPGDRRRFRKQIEGLVEQGKGTGEMSLLSADGREVPYFLSARALSIEGYRHVVAVGIDLTRRKEAEQAFHRAQKLESLGVMAGGVAHDFNNLLQAILGRSSLALARLAADDDVRPQVEAIEQAARQAAELTGQLLAYSGKSIRKLQIVDLNRVIIEARPLLESSIAHRATLQLDLDEEVPAIEADAAQIQQIILNLLINAVEATDDGGAAITVTTATTILGPENEQEWSHMDWQPAPGKYVTLSVSDKGRGMDQATQRKIFDPFFSTKEMGRGLGLAAVLGIIRGHHGAIRVQSEPGRGATFTLFFPAEESVPPVQKAENGTLNGFMGVDEMPAGICRTVLVIDDQENVRQAVAEALLLMGLEVLTAEDGERALEVYRERSEEIDLVLLDMTMPGLSAAETYRRLRKMQPSLRVVLTSGYDLRQVRAQMAGTQIAGTLQKPYDLQTLQRTIEAVCGSRQRDELRAQPVKV